MSPQICWSTQIQRACLVDWSESTVIITKTTDWYCSKATTSVLYSEGRIRLVPVALYANGCPRWHIINSITNLSNNPRKPLVKQRQSSEREFAVVLLLTADRDRRFKEWQRRHCDTAVNATEVPSFIALPGNRANLAQAVTLLLFNLELPSSNFGGDTECITGVFCGFLQSFQANSGVYLETCHHRFPSNPLKFTRRNQFVI
jgi:hypothetical protein